MAHTYANLAIHVIFSTKDRLPEIGPEIRPRLFAYMGGVLRELGCVPMSVNGTEDHVHGLVGLPTTRSVAEVLRVLKTNSSKWVHDEFPDRRAFAWQSGYGGFSVSQSNVEAVRQYITTQEEHHRTMSFQEEFLTFLQRHGIAYDPRYVWE